MIKNYDMLFCFLKLKFQCFMETFFLFDEGFPF